MKNLLNLSGAKELSRKEQQSISGGAAYPCDPGENFAIIPLGQASCIANGGVWQSNLCYYCY
ncbi:MAG: hypothetical protein AAFX55_15305 [Bacteroidota bacterium]